jgi:hypothetical protein
MALNDTEKTLREERIGLEGEDRRGKIDGDRTNLEGAMSMCQSGPSARECIANILRNDIAQLRGINAGDRNQLGVGSPNVSAPIRQNNRSDVLRPAVRHQAPDERVVCILPSGQETSLSYAACLTQGGTQYEP